MYSNSSGRANIRKIEKRPGLRQKSSEDSIDIDRTDTEETILAADEYHNDEKRSAQYQESGRDNLGFVDTNDIMNNINIGNTFSNGYVTPKTELSAPVTSSQTSISPSWKRKGSRIHPTVPKTVISFCEDSPQQNNFSDENNSEFGNSNRPVSPTVLRSSQGNTYHSPPMRRKNMTKHQDTDTFDYVDKDGEPRLRHYSRRDTNDHLHVPCNEHLHSNPNRDMIG